MKVLVEREVEFRYPDGWVSMDKDGYFNNYEKKPNESKHDHEWEYGDESCGHEFIDDLKGFFVLKPIDWKDSLMTVSDFKEKYGVK